jgi:hypothetical protein
MNNLLKKSQMIQFIVILLIYSFSNINDKEVIKKDNPYYTFIEKNLTYNEITNNILNDEATEEYKLLLKGNEYFYLFYNHHVYVYFYKEIDSNDHIIYFNGIKNMNDLKIIFKSIRNIIFNDIDHLFDKEGRLYKMNNDSISYQDNQLLFDVFDRIYDNNQNIKLKINGFSFGGPMSQLFTLKLLEKYGEEKLSIDIYNIESWFGGNKEMYEDLKNKVEIHNIYNSRSIMYFYNIIFQKYFQSDYLIENNNDYDEIINSAKDLPPFGLINYIVDNHLLSKIFNKKKNIL